MINRADDDLILERFRQWLADTQAEADATANGDLRGGRPAGGPAIGWLQVVEEFTALRHEVKLGTKSSRSLEEQAARMVTAMQEAIVQFRSVEAKESQAAEEAARPLAESLADLDEALRRGREAIESVQRRMADTGGPGFRERLQRLFSREPAWRRWLSRRWHRVVETCARVRRSTRKSLRVASGGLRDHPYPPASGDGKRRDRTDRERRPSL